jgi:hypothetical protein
MNIYDDLEKKQQPEEGEQIQAIINDNNELVIPEQLQLDLEF